jgi:DNA mismatch endonuclease (patch repair protein)
MSDVVDKKTRSRMMSGIKGKNTKPELLIRSALHKDGFRFRIHVNDLPGKPDLVLKKYNATIFIHGCFWHKHNCKFFKLPKSRTDFWLEKLNKNLENDNLNMKKLSDLGWRICIIWECSIRNAKYDINSIKNQVENWLKSESGFLEVIG